MNQLHQQSLEFVDLFSYSLPQLVNSSPSSKVPFYSLIMFQSGLRLTVYTGTDNSDQFKMSGLLQFPLIT
eukprot:403341509